MWPLSTTTDEVPLGPVVEIIIALVTLLGGAATWKWYFGDRKRERVDNAKVVNDMAVATVKELLAPITAQAADLRHQLEKCEERATQLEHHLEQVLGYAYLAHLGWGSGGVEPHVPDIVLDRARG